MPDLIDLTAATIEHRERRKRELAAMAASLCHASSANSFLNAVEWWQDQIEELERAGKCIACGWQLDGHAVCRECGREQ